VATERMMAETDPVMRSFYHRYCDYCTRQMDAVTNRAIDHLIEATIE
jgi:hypothetical protein